MRGFSLFVPILAMCIATTAGFLLGTAPALADEPLQAEEVAFILSKNPCTAPCQVNEASSKYSLTPIDLNGDSVPEYLVRDLDCGSAGCAEGLFMRASADWKKLLGVAIGGINISSKRTNGFLDVVVWHQEYEPQRHEVRVAYHWNGERYISK